jgi:hypothetical protein
MGDVSSSVLRFATGTYTVTRRTPAAPVNGRAQAPTLSTFTASMCVQPLDGRALLRLPEAMRAEERRVVFSPVALQTAGASEPDTVAIDGADWEVEDVEAWDGLGNYWKATVRKVSLQ